MCYLHHISVSHGVRGQVKLLHHVLDVQVSLSLPIGLQQPFFVLQPSKYVCGRCRPAHAGQVPSDTSLSPAKKHGKSLSLVESLRDGILRIAAKSITMCDEDACVACTLCRPRASHEISTLSGRISSCILRFFICCKENKIGTHPCSKMTTRVNMGGLVGNQTFKAW